MPDQTESPESSPTVVSVAEYRKLTGDRETSDEVVVSRLQYLEALCKNVCAIELESYGHVPS